MYEEFLKKLNELKDMAFIQGGYVTNEQIEEFFGDLDEDKKAIILDYLKNNHIGLNEAIDPNSYLSENDINLLDMYVESLEEIEVMDEDLKKVLKRDCLRGDKNAKNRLMQQYLKSIIDVAKLYSGQGVNMMDLIGEGNVALAIAFESIDAMEDIEEFDPLIMRMVMNAMEEMITLEGDEHKIEAKSLEISEKVRKAAKEMAESILRKVSVEELAKESGISKNQIREALRLSESIYDFVEKDSQ